MRRGIALAYHGIGDVDDATDPMRLVVSLSHLESHLRLLLRLGYRFVTAEEVLAAGRVPRGAAALTFDDGFRTWLTLGVPLLQRLGARATFYVTTGWLGGQHPLVSGVAGEILGEDEARALVEAGMELGAHTVTHPDLRTLTDAELAQELRDSRLEVENLSGRPCRTMAYPYGLYDERARRAAATTGYGLAWEWLPGPWDLLAAPRIPAPPRHGARRLAPKLLGIRRPGR